MISIHQYGQGAEQNSRLCALVRAFQQRCASRRAEGWTSPSTFFQFPKTQPLQSFIRSCLKTGYAWTLLGWANVLKSGEVMDWHDHVYPGNVFSGVYFPQSGGGAIEFEDGQKVQPEASTMVLFPVTLRHRVIADAERVSIAFNAR